MILFVFAASFPPFDTLTDVNLPLHMLQHVLIALGGVMIGYPLYRSGRFDSIKSPRNGLAGFAVITSLVVMWHLPFFWDAAVVNLYVHMTEHVCFLFIGLMIGIFIPMLPDGVKVAIVVLAIMGHMFYGFVLYIATTPVYPLYPLNQQAELGLALFAPSPIYLIGFLYLSLTRESRKLEREDAEIAQLAAPRATAHATTFKGKKRSSKIPATRLLILFFSVIMIASLVGYYGYTTATIIAPPRAVPSPRVSVIYIVENPVSWQYSPQHITVVLGWNNTVTWVSHSYSEDTVTSANNTFPSANLGPGQTFSFEFTQPGTYLYYCKYHLWMTGTIQVVSSK